MTLAQVQARIAAHPVTGTPDDMRRAFEALAVNTAQGQWVSRAGMSARVFGEGSDVVWLHGGGYVFGSPDSHAASAASLAQMAGMRVWVPAYRLAHEHIWPAQLDDATDFIRSFDSPVAVVGDSAGGHLALNIARRADANISALALISPNTDRSGLSATRRTNSLSDLMNDADDDAALARMAMPHLDHASHDASPLLANLSGLPPVWVTAATNEVLLDDTLLLIRALGRAGVTTQADIKKGLFHLWTLWPDLLPDARDTLSKIAAFLRASKRIDPTKGS